MLEILVESSCHEPSFRVQTLSRKRTRCRPQTPCRPHPASCVSAGLTRAPTCNQAPATDEWSKAELIDALFRPHDARAERRAEEGGYLEDYLKEMREIDAGLPRGTLARLEKAFLAAPPARPGDIKGV